MATRTVNTSSKVTISGVDEDPYAPSQVSMISSPEEAGKRRRRASKSRLAKEAARTRRRRRSPPQSVPPGAEDEEEDDGLAPEIFENLRGVLPERDAQELLVEMADLTKGYEAQSESAKTRVSRMEIAADASGQGIISHASGGRRRDAVDAEREPVAEEDVGLGADAAATTGSISKRVS